MNFGNILNKIADTDPEFYERTSERRRIFKTMGRGLALAAIPFAVGAVLKKAYGKTNASVVDVLNYALTLEYLEAEFYNLIVATDAMSGYIPTTAARNAIKKIADDENKHVAFLQAVIPQFGGVAVGKPAIDLTGGGGSGMGPFATVTTDYALMLAVSQAFEDTGVRAYKGRAGELMVDNTALTAALNIHSVEARHASHIRWMRMNAGAPVKPWITGKDTGGIGALVQANYDGEETTLQGTVQTTDFANFNVATESFDEPLNETQVLAILKPAFLP